MRKSQIVGLLFTLVFGTILHYVYSLSGESAAIALIAPINESVWEHTKLIVTPVLAYAVYEYFLYGMKTDGFVAVRVFSVVTAIVCMISLYYTYSGIVGNNYLIADILVFVISVVLCYRVSCIAMSAGFFYGRIWSVTAYIVLILLIAAYCIFTFKPPHISLFCDPVTLLYGA